MSQVVVNIILLIVLNCLIDTTMACSSDLNCSLNGLCNKTSGMCVCDPAWYGADCAKLALLPTEAESDVRLDNVSTWGMTVFARRASVRSEAGGRQSNKSWEWHGLFAEMTRSCGLTSWETNSKVSHAVAPGPNGPWTRQGTVLGVWAHTPSATIAADGTILLFHIGNGSTPGAALPGSREYNATCTAGRSPCGTHPFHHCNASYSDPGPRPGPGPGPGPGTRPISGLELGPEPIKGTDSVDGVVNFHVADNPDGPWRKAAANIVDERGLVTDAMASGDLQANNFAFDTPFTHPNGTIYVVTAGRAILRAMHWRGPYEVIATGACGGGEDNYIYIDQRGHFHCLYHRAPFSDLEAQGGHAYSLDGYTWHVSDTPAYPAKQAYADGSIHFYGKRERPHLIFDPETGAPTHLTNGVCLNGNWSLCNNNPYPGYFDYTFTTVAPLKTS